MGCLGGRVSWCHSIDLLPKPWLLHLYSTQVGCTCYMLGVHNKFVNWNSFTLLLHNKTSIDLMSKKHENSLPFYINFIFIFHHLFIFVEIQKLKFYSTNNLS